MWGKIAQRARTVLIILAPPVKMFLAEWGAFVDFPQPAFPINRLSGCIVIEGIIPFACDAIARVPRLRPDELADFAGFDQIRAFLVATRRATLRANLKDFLCLFNGIMNLESLVQIARERFLTINMFSKLHAIDRDLRVP